MRNQLLGDRYRIKGLIGEGGMASVYVAIDEKLGRRVAIKILHAHLTQHADIRQRFHQEARAVSQLDHPNIIKVFDFSGEDSSQLWIVSEVLKGKNLAQYVQKFRNSALHPIVGTLIAREICRALQYAHSKGIVHRDIKPENIMVLTDGRIKLMDFGISKNLRRSDVTMTGTMMGSPSYMSPEQIRGRDMDHRTDIYSLAVLHYEIICGILPFIGNTTPDVISKIMAGRYLAPNKILPEIPRTLSNIIVKGMNLKAEDRFSNAQSLGEALDGFLREFGFIESHVELERFFHAPEQFDMRLRELNVKFKNEVTKKANRPPSLPTVRHQNARTRMIDAEHQTEVATLRQALGSEMQPTMRGPNHRTPTQITTRHQPPKPGRVPPSAPTSQPPRAWDYRRPKVPTGGGQNSGGVRHQRAADKRPNYRRMDAHTMAFPPAGSYHQRNPRRILMWTGGLLLVVAAFLYFGLAKMSREFMEEVAYTTAMDIPKPKKTRKSQRQTKVAKRPPVTASVEKQDPAELPAAAIPSPKADPTTELPSFKRPERAIDNKKESSVKSYDIKTPPPKVKPVKKSPSRRVIGKKAPEPPTKPKTTGPAVAVVEKAPSTPDRPAPSREIPASSSSAPKTGKPTGEQPVKEAYTAPESVAPPTTPEAVKPAPESQSTAEVPVFIIAEPAAQVLIDGRDVGTTNDLNSRRRGFKVPPGSHTLELRRSGFKTLTTSIEASPGKKNRFSYTLTREEKTVRFTLRTSHFPATARIQQVNGDKKMEINLSSNSSAVNLAPGTYQVTMSFGGKTIERTVTLSSRSGALTFNADFTKFSSQGEKP